MKEHDVHSTKKIKRVFVKDEAYNMLEEAIVNGDLAPNARLKINELSETLGISRTPIREAILRLENEGLVISKANQWTIVAPIRIDSIKYIYPLVYDLEAFCLKDGFVKIDRNFTDELRKINALILEENQHSHQESLLELDNTFHNKIIQLSENIEVRPILDSLKRKLRRLETLFYKSKKINEPPSSYEEHLALIEALEEGDLQKSLKKLEINWTNVLDKDSLAQLRREDAYKDYFV
uniref:GntR family transcriptional regulator n=1 Tax=Ndongobacter massiliensis TaxID=1871025 RepID=UPI000931A4C8|nr:GntR family transcriptional regulator [Ndongobacter massiliensis]